MSEPRSSDDSWSAVAKEAIRRAPELLALVAVVWLFIGFLQVEATRATVTAGEFAQAVKELSTAVGRLEVKLGAMEDERRNDSARERHE